ncbi:hypothetical protein CPC08DRAFT_519916 [Agrocybe pediades]|nr:hypothetical protein CPC08DRAFT_519916 [Agrocybe pediades]
MEQGSSSTVSASGRMKRVLPARTRRGGPGVGSCDADILILETSKRQYETEPLISLDTRFLLTTNSEDALNTPESNEAGIRLNTVANERYFSRPEVLKAFREQQIIQTPDFESIGESSTVGGRMRPRGAEDEAAETSDAAYEKRHRKFETLEKRQRLREKEKLRHEHYKLKERIEQLRVMDSSAFMAAPASYFTPAPPQATAELDELVASQSQYALLNGGLTHAEGERRRKEMLDAAYRLEKRYAYLLPPDRVRKVVEHPVEPQSKAQPDAREEEDSDSERIAAAAGLSRREPDTSKGRPSARPSISATPTATPGTSKKKVRGIGLPKHSTSRLSKSSVSTPSSAAPPRSISPLIDIEMQSPEPAHTAFPTPSPMPLPQTPRFIIMGNRAEPSSRMEDVIMRNEENQRPVISHIPSPNMPAPQPQTYFQPTIQPFVLPPVEPIAEPARERAPEPPMQELVHERVVEPAVQPIEPEQLFEPVVEPVVGPVGGPLVDYASDSGPEPFEQPEPVIEPVAQKPTFEPTPEASSHSVGPSMSNTEGTAVIVNEPETPSSYQGEAQEAALAGPSTEVAEQVSEAAGQGRKKGGKKRKHRPQDALARHRALKAAARAAEAEEAEEAAQVEEAVQAGQDADIAQFSGAVETPQAVQDADNAQFLEVPETPQSAEAPEIPQPAQSARVAEAVPLVEPIQTTEAAEATETIPFNQTSPSQLQFIEENFGAQFAQPSHATQPSQDVQPSEATQSTQFTEVHPEPLEQPVPVVKKKRNRPGRPPKVRPVETPAVSETSMATGVLRTDAAMVVTSEPATTSVAGGQEPGPSVVEPTLSVASKPKRTYKRRKVVVDAQPSEAATTLAAGDQEEPSVAEPAEPVRVKRSYKRRNVVVDAEATEPASTSAVDDQEEPTQPARKKRPYNRRKVAVDAQASEPVAEETLNDAEPAPSIPQKRPYRRRNVVVDETPEPATTSAAVDQEHPESLSVAEPAQSISGKRPYKRRKMTTESLAGTPSAQPETVTTTKKRGGPRKKGQVSYSYLSSTTGKLEKTTSTLIMIASRQANQEQGREEHKLKRDPWAIRLPKLEDYTAEYVIPEYIYDYAEEHADNEAGDASQPVAGPSRAEQHDQEEDNQDEEQAMEVDIEHHEVNVVDPDEDAEEADDRPDIESEDEPMQDVPQMDNYSNVHSPDSSVSGAGDNPENTHDPDADETEETQLDSIQDDIPVYDDSHFRIKPRILSRPIDDDEELLEW